jgi:hypothetical protein
MKLEHVEIVVTGRNSAPDLEEQSQLIWVSDHTFKKRSQNPSDHTFKERSQNRSDHGFIVRETDHFGHQKPVSGGMNIGRECRRMQVHSKSPPVPS